MKIVFVSDTHGELSLLKEVALKEYDASVYFHLGDSECEANEIAPFCSVKGNCDSSLFHYPLSRTFVLPSGKKIFLRHHPFSSVEDYRNLEKEGFSYFIHGHTHKRREEQIGNLKVYCPGSLDYPRDGNYGSYLVLEANEEGETFQFRSI